MTLNEVLEKRNAARARHKEFKDQFEPAENYPVNMLNAEYDWGFWDAVVTIMKNFNMKIINVKAVL